MFLVPLVIHERESEGIVILDLKGRINLGPEDTSLRQQLRSLLESWRKKVILNLRRVAAIDNVAVGSLVICAETFQNAGGRLVLLNGVPDHTALDDLLKLDTSLPVYSDEQDAINSFFPERKVTHYDLLEFLKAAGHSETDRELQKEPG